MIIGAHFLLYSKDPEADRAFFRDVLGFRSTDAGQGWLIFALPPAELGIHPMDKEFSQQHASHPMLGSIMYLMCADVHSFVASLKVRNIQCSEVQPVGWGITTTIPLPSGGAIGLYQPTHETALNLK
jgi:hypothetical protein